MLQILDKFQNSCVPIITLDSFVAAEDSSQFYYLTDDDLSRRALVRRVDEAATLDSSELRAKTH